MLIATNHIETTNWELTFNPGVKLSRESHPSIVRPRRGRGVDSLLLWRHSNSSLGFTSSQSGRFLPTEVTLLCTHFITLYTPDAVHSLYTTCMIKWNEGMKVLGYSNHGPINTQYVSPLKTKPIPIRVSRNAAWTNSGRYLCSQVGLEALNYPLLSEGRWLKQQFICSRELLEA